MLKQLDIHMKKRKLDNLKKLTQIDLKSNYKIQNHKTSER